MDSPWASLFETYNNQREKVAWFSLVLGHLSEFSSPTKLGIYVYKRSEKYTWFCSYSHLCRRRVVGLFARVVEKIERSPKIKCWFNSSTWSFTQLSTCSTFFYYYYYYYYNTFHRSMKNKETEVAEFVWDILHLCLYEVSYWRGRKFAWRN